MNWLTGAAAVVLIIGAFFLGKGSTETVVVYEQQQIDENTWVRKSSYNDRGNIIDSLSTQADSLKQILSARNSEILNLTQANATLRIELDSLETSVIIIPELVNVPDTTASISARYNLFNIRVDYGVRQGAVFAEITDFTQVRPIEFTVLTDRRNETIKTFVFSSDFEELNFTTQHSIQQPRFGWYHYAGAGFVTATILFLLL